MNKHTMRVLLNDIYQQATRRERACDLKYLLERDLEMIADACKDGMAKLGRKP